MYKLLDWIEWQATQVSVTLICRRSVIYCVWFKFCVWVLEPTIKYLKKWFPPPVVTPSTEEIQMDEILLYDPNDYK